MMRDYGALVAHAANRPGVWRLVWSGELTVKNVSTASGIAFALRHGGRRRRSIRAVSRRTESRIRVFAMAEPINRGVS